MIVEIPIITGEKHCEAMMLHLRTIEVYVSGQEHVDPFERKTKLVKLYWCCVCKKEFGVNA